MNNWINIKDKLPNHMETVLALHEKGNQIVMIFVSHRLMNKKLKLNNLPTNSDENGYSFSSQEISGNTLKGITHWMPLPELPR